MQEVMMQNKDSRRPKNGASVDGRLVGRGDDPPPRKAQPPRRKGSDELHTRSTRLTPAHDELLEQAATADGTSPSDYVREALLLRLADDLRLEPIDPDQYNPRRTIPRRAARTAELTGMSHETLREALEAVAAKARDDLLEELERRAESSVPPAPRAQKRSR